MANRVRFHAGWRRRGDAAHGQVDCLSTLANALDSLIQEAGWVASIHAERHQRACDAHPWDRTACDCPHYQAHVQALELAQLCLEGEVIPSFTVADEEFWARPVEGCPCACDGLCGCLHVDELNAHQEESHQ
ncbi:hypothetical protein [Streptomyces nigrescens]